LFIIKCDRCGKEKTVNNLLPNFSQNQEENTHVQKYSILEIGQKMKTITLCEECEKDFEIFLS
jgi:hypothetical protein